MQLFFSRIGFHASFSTSGSRYPKGKCCPDSQPLYGHSPLWHAWKFLIIASILRSSFLITIIFTPNSNLSRSVCRHLPPVYFVMIVLLPKFNYAMYSPLPTQKKLECGICFDATKDCAFNCGHMLCSEQKSLTEKGSLVWWSFLWHKF